jgi:tetratricopeptide (TPR) repeat protein
MFKVAVVRPFVTEPTLKELFSDPVRMAVVVLTRQGELADAFGRLAGTLGNGNYHAVHGMLLKATGRAEQAEAALRRSLAAPGLVRTERLARIDLADLLLARAGREAGAARGKCLEEARGLVRWLSASGPFPPGAHRRLCPLAVAVGDGTAALAWAEEWARLAPGDADAMRALTDAAFAVSAYDRAWATLGERLKLKPGDTDLLNQRCVAAYRMRVYTLALADALDVMRRKPDHKWAPGNLDAIAERLRANRAVVPMLLAKLDLRQALILAGRGEHAKAVGMIESAKEKEPAVEVLFARACVYSLASRAAAGDKGLSAEERGGVVERYAGLAAALLEKARAAGYFDEAARCALRDGDGDLAPIRGREDYKKATRGKR